MIKIFLILAFLFTNGCALMVAKETAKVLDTVLEEKPNPTKKEKILENTKKKTRKLIEKPRKNPEN